MIVRLAMLISGIVIGILNPCYANTYTVTSTVDHPITGAGISVNGANGVITGGSGNGLVTIRSAIAAANTIPAGPHTINVPAGTYNLTIAGTGEGLSPAQIDKGDLDVTANNVTIDGAGMNTTIINQTSGIDRVFDVNVNFIPDFNFTCTDMTISGGREQTGNGGGGMFTGSKNNEGIVTITNVKFDNNQAFTAMGFMGNGFGGGGLQHQGGDLVLTNCIFNNNSTTKSGGGLNAFGYQDLPIVMSINNVMTVTNCTFTNNTCNGASGGGAIDFAAVNLTTSTITVSGCTFSGNVSTASPGGAIVNESTALTVEKCTFLNNTANLGGGVYVGGGPGTTVRFCRLIGNIATTPNGGNGFGVAGGTLNANNNWWGVNTGPSAADAIMAGSGTLTLTRWLQLRHTASPASVNVNPPGSSTTLTASFLTNSMNEAIAAANLTALVGLPIVFNNAVKGSLSMAQTSIQATATATATYTVFMTSCPPTGSADATVDNQTTTATITIIDNLPPTPVCNNITANLTSASYSFPPADSAAIILGTIEHCGLTTTFNPPTLGCMNVGPNVITVTYTDDAGNTASCTATVTLVDVVPPMALCKNVTVNLDANGMGSTTAAAVDNGSSDACGIQSLSLSQTSFDCDDLGANLVTLTVTDNNGLTATCTANVQVVDNIFPTITCPGNQTANADASCQTMLPDYTSLVTSADNCDYTVVQTPTPGTVISGHGTVQVITMTATDIAGNSASCTFNYTVQDITPPVASCMHITVQLNSMGMVTITPSSVNNGSTDNCSIMGMQVSQTSFICSDVGPNEVTLTVTDVAGLTATCTAIVTVVDPPPMAICQDVTVNLDANGMGSTTAAAVDNGSSDACGLQSIVLSQTSFDCTDLGPNTVTLTVTDNNNNTATCTAIVTIVDMIPPMVTCPGDQTEFVDANCRVSLPDYTGLVTASDNCMVSTISQSPAPGTILTGHGTIQAVTITAIDQSGNRSTCMFNVALRDMVPPMAICMDITVELDMTGMASIAASQIDGGSTDNCGIMGLQVSQTNFTCSNTGSTSVTLTVTDVAGNTSTCTAKVTVTDPLGVCCAAPTAMCEDITVSLDDMGMVTITGAQVENGSTVECGLQSLTVDPNMFDCNDLGQNIVTLTVTDINGNTDQCTATVTVEDDLSPTTMNCDMGDDLNCNPDPAEYTADDPPIWADNCGVSMTGTVPGTPVNTLGCEWSVTHKYWATDVSMNSDTCYQTFTWTEDTTPPDLTCPDDLTIECDQNADYVQLIKTWLETASALDLCGNAVVEDDYNGVSLPDVSCDGSFVLKVRFTAKDDCGNTTTCTRNVTIEDTTPPEIMITQSPVTIGCDDDPATVVTGYSAIDACSDVTVSAEVVEGFCNADAALLASGNVNSYQATNWYKIEVDGLNEGLLDASDMVSLDLKFYIDPGQAASGGKGNVEFWLVNPCNEAIRLVGPNCVDLPVIPFDDGCGQRGLFNPVFEFTDPCRQQWINYFLTNNMGVKEKFRPYENVTGPVMLGDLAVTAYESVGDFTCNMINGDWYVFGRKNSASLAVEFQGACLETCPKAYTRVITVKDACDQTAQGTQILVRGDACACGTILYVDQDAMGLSDGLTWASAFTNLQSGLSAAAPGDQIWVAEGTYTPGTGRTSTFRPVSGVAMYGGFEGNETDISQRDIAMHPTILSGEIGGGGVTDNCYHVITADACLQKGYVNGFIIEDGYANGFFLLLRNRGAGILCQGELDLILSEIRDCHSTNAGSAVYNNGSSAKLLLEDCVLTNNDQLTGTAVLNINGGSLTVRNTNTVQE